MNIKDYSYIVAVVDHGSFSKAAEALYLSQPSLSAYVHNLERQLGILFFESDKRTLTPEGELYVSYARQVIALDQKLMQELKQLHRLKENRIRLGITPGRSEQYLDALYERFQQSDCIYEPEISVDTTRNLIEKLQNNDLDMILINHPQETRGLVSQVIFTDRLLLAAHKSNPAVKLAYEVPGDKYRHLPVDALSGCRFIIFPKGRSLRAAFDRLCTESELSPEIVQESPSIRSACKLVSRNFGVTFVFDIASDLENLDDRCECFYVDADCLNVDYILASSAERPLPRELKKACTLIQDIINRAHRQQALPDGTATVQNLRA